MNLSLSILTFIEGFMMALYLGQYVRLKRDCDRTTGTKGRTIFRMASLLMLQTSVLCLYLLACTLHEALGFLGDGIYIERLFCPIFHLWVVLLEWPFICMISYSIVRARQGRFSVIGYHQLAMLLGMLCFLLTGWGWLIDVVNAFMLLLFLYISGSIIVYAQRYQRQLDQIYSNTDRRGVVWILGFLVVMVMQATLWLSLCAWLDSTWSHIVFYIESTAVTLIYNRMLESQNYDVEEVGLKPEPTEVAVSSDSLAAAMRLLDQAIPQYCLTEQHFADPDLSVIDLSKAVGSNRTYVARWFSDRGTNFSSYINELRVTYAEQLLRQSVLSTSEVGLQAGFNTIQTFSRVFKSKYGCTPEQYRQRQKYPL